MTVCGAAHKMMAYEHLCQLHNHIHIHDVLHDGLILFKVEIRVTEAI